MGYKDIELIVSLLDYIETLKRESREIDENSAGKDREYKREIKRLQEDFNNEEYDRMVLGRRLIAFNNAFCGYCWACVNSKPMGKFTKAVTCEHLESRDILGKIGKEKGCKHWKFDEKRFGGDSDD
jgi:hypothetical protein